MKPRTQPTPATIQQLRRRGYTSLRIARELGTTKGHVRRVLRHERGVTR